MALGGEYYDDANKDFTPNKDRKMAEWRAKKKQEDADSMERKMDILHGRAEPNEYGGRSQKFHEAHGKEDQMPTTLFDNLGNPNF